MNEDSFRAENYQKTQHAYDLLKVVTTRPEIFTDISHRVEALKQITPAELVRFLSFTNGLLRKGSPGNEEEIVQEMNVSGVGGSDFESSPDAKKNFITLIDSMNQNINEENYKNWAIKLYLGINLAHLFPDGNGRLSRTTYEFLTTGILPSDENIQDRPVEAGQVASLFYEEAITRLLNAEVGLEVDGESFWGYKAGDTKDAVFKGEITSVVKYIAAARVLKKHGVYKGENKIVFSESPFWTEEMRQEFAAEYTQVRNVLFFSAIEMVDEYQEYAENALEVPTSPPSQSGRE